jgi:hypothetical protein
METADWKSDRRITDIRLSQNTETGRLGVKISHMYFLYSGLMVWKQLTGSLTKYCIVKVRLSTVAATCLSQR